MIARLLFPQAQPAGLFGSTMRNSRCGQSVHAHWYRCTPSRPKSGSGSIAMMIMRPVQFGQAIIGRVFSKLPQSGFCGLPVVASFSASKFATFSSRAVSLASMERNRLGKVANFLQIGIFSRIFMMSDVEKEIIPQPHKTVASDLGLVTWRPVVTSLTVHRIAGQPGARHLVVREDDVERVRFRLSKVEADHLAALLVEEGAQ